MDYRLVRQFSNNAWDNFFNFFYKIADFFTVLMDCFWAFYDIWYCFVMIFVNIVLFFYYMTLYIIDKLTFSRASVLFWRTTYADSGVRKITKAYSRESYNPVSGRFGAAAAAASTAGSTAVKATSATAVKSVAAVSAVASSAASAAATVVDKPFNRRPEGARKSFFKEFFEGVVNVAEKFWKKINLFGEWFKKTILSKLKPVREEEAQGRKSLVESYVKDYEKRRR